MSRRVALAGLASIACTGAVLGSGLGIDSASGRLLTTVRASDFGFDPVDSTSILQQALDSVADIVIIDLMVSDWITGPLVVTRSNVTILLEDGVVVRALSGAFPHDGNADSEKLLTIEGRTQVTVIGYGATLAMNKTEYPTGEWRHAVNVLSCSDLTIEGLEITGSGGDGIYLGVSTNTSLPRYNSNVVLRNVVCDNHRRNALSVITVDGLLVEGCAFVNTHGTFPGAGIDLEPNSSVERLVDVVFRDCVVSGNQKRGVIVAYSKLKSTSPPISVLFDRLTIADQAGGEPGFAVYGSGTSDPGGTIELIDSLIAKDTLTTSVGIFNKAADGAHVTFTRVSFWDLDTPHSYYDSFVVWATKATGADPISEYGGLTWTDSIMITDHFAPFLSIREIAGGLGLANVHGNLAVVGRGATSSSAITQDLGASPHDVDHVLSTSTVVPSNTVSLAVDSTNVSAGGAVEITVSRVTGDLTVPLAVRLALSGTARTRYDYDGFPESITIAAGQVAATRTLTTRVAGDTSYSRSATIGVVPTSVYTLGVNATATVTISNT